MPLLKLSRTGGGKAGRLQAVPREAWEPRAGRDPDIDSTRTPGNVYEGEQSAAALIAEIERQVDEYSEARRAAGGRAVRDSAAVAACMVIKPEMGWINGQSLAEQQRFFRDARQAVTELMGREPLSSVVHVDEVAPHMHLMFDARMADGSINGDKAFGLSAKKALNSGFAARMRELGGWDITPADVYDPERAATDPEYQAQRRAKRAKHGRSSVEYKRDRTQEALDGQEAAQKAAQAVLRAAEAQAAQIRRDAQEALRRAQKAEERAQRERERVLDALSDAQDALGIVQGMQDELTAQRASEGPLRAFVARYKSGADVLAKYDQEQAKKARQRAGSTKGAKDRLLRAARLIEQQADQGRQLGD